MSQDTKDLLDAASKHKFTPADKEEHRRSFAYGNTRIENERVTRELIDREADKLAHEKTQQK
jgi:hypothetical protein